MISFGYRLKKMMDARGPVCVGIDPHPPLLESWGLPDNAEGVREFGLRVVDALYDRAAAFKPQSAFFERHGSAGVAALEEILEACRQAEVPTITDAKRGDIGSTMDGYADAYLEGSLRSDAFTVSPYLGVSSLWATAKRAAQGGQGLFVLALTSNPEGAELQHVGEPSVAARVVQSVTSWNETLTPAGETVGSFGLVVGATIGDAAHRLGIDLSAFPGIFLAPGVGAQGAGGDELRQVFGSGIGHVLASASRSVLAGGPSQQGLREAFGSTLNTVEVATA